MSPFLIRKTKQTSVFVNLIEIPKMLIQTTQFDALWVTQDPIENDNRPFQYASTSNETTTVLEEQQQTDNTNSATISTLTNPQTSDLGPLHVPTRIINTYNSLSVPQTELGQ